MSAKKYPKSLRPRAIKLEGHPLPVRVPVHDTGDLITDGVQRPLVVCFQFHTGWKGGGRAALAIEQTDL